MGDRFPGQISLREVSRIYGRSFALHRLSLTLKAGQVTAIAGDNGAGKSTLLNLLATTDEPTSGEILFDEMSRAQFARRGRRQIGWVGHDALLYNELTARENLRFFARMYGINDALTRVDSWLQRVGLSDVADRQVRTYSRGMKQRLTLARALLHSPQLLLFDEPATGLDQQGKDFVLGLLAQLRDRGRLILLVTHDFSLIEGAADRLVVLRRGKISHDSLLDGVDPLEVYATHA